MNTSLEEQSASAKMPIEELGEICRRADAIHGEWLPLIDIAIDFIRCNVRVRDIVAVALRLAALPSHELDNLEMSARACWRNAEDEARELERIHGPLPAHPADALPTPSWAKSRAA